MNMVIEIAVAISVFIFALLAFFIIRTLCAFQQSLRRINQLLWEMEIKMKNVDPLLRTLSNLGECCEQETERLKKACLVPRTEEAIPKLSFTSEIVEWILVSLNLVKKIFTRR